MRLLRDEVALVDATEALREVLAELALTLPHHQRQFVTWADGTDDQIRERLRHGAPLANNRWQHELAILVDGAPVGLQTLTGFAAWPRRKVVGTSSWLGPAHQGNGFGTSARTAVLDLAFTHLGTAAARSWVLADNTASRRVSEKLGYLVVAEQCGELIYELADWESHGTVLDL